MSIPSTIPPEGSPDATTDSLPSGVGAITLEACAWCSRPTDERHVTPVLDEGRLCPKCFDELRMEALAS